MGIIFSENKTFSFRKHSLLSIHSTSRTLPLVNPLYFANSRTLPLVYPLYFEILLSKKHIPVVPNQNYFIFVLTFCLWLDFPWFVDLLFRCFVVSLFRCFVVSLIHWSIDSLFRWFIDSLIRWFVDSLICWFLIRWFIDLLFRWFFDSLIQWLDIIFVLVWIFFFFALEIWAGFVRRWRLSSEGMSTMTRKYFNSGIYCHSKIL